MLIAVERRGPVRAVSIDSEKVATMQPVINQHLCKSSHLISDMHRSHMAIGKQFAVHSYVNHSLREYSRGNVHTNTAESFAGIVKRARVGVFHYMSQLHLNRYMNEFEFRWNNRVSYGYKKSRLSFLRRPACSSRGCGRLCERGGAYCRK